MKKLIVILSIGIGLVACDDFLETQPDTRITAQDFLDSEIEVEQAIIGLYNHFRNYYGGEMWKWGEFRSDNTSFQYNPTDRGGELLEQIDEFVMNALNNQIGPLWNGGYTGIFRANVILQAVEEVSFSEAEASDYVEGQARFFRAFYYFIFVRTFGDVPLITEPIQSGSEGEAFAAIRRTDLQTIYDELIIPDLVSAASLLPDTWPQSDAGRATSGAASTLLGDVYMTLGRATDAIAALEPV